MARLTILSLLPFLAISWAMPTTRGQEADCDCEINLAATGVSSAVRPKVLIAGIGGWKSCLGKVANDQYISNRFLSLVEHVRRCRPDWDVSYVMFCSPGLKTAKFDGEVRYYGRFGAGMVAEQNIGACIARHKETPDSKVFVMGHSHGGWMAMRATICLGHVDGLFTMEPVSGAQCDTRDYLKNRTRKIFKRRQQIVPGCRRAPTDVDWHAVLAASGGNWTNFFLAPNTQKGDVYSSPISVAHNVMIWAPAQGKYNAHHNLGLSAQTWSVIENGILAALAPPIVASPSIVPGPTLAPVPLPIAPPTDAGSSSETEAEVAEPPQASLPSAEQNTDALEHIEYVDTATRPVRTWWNSDRSKSRQGYFVEVTGDEVVIELLDGTHRRTRVEALSPEDQSWLSMLSDSAGS